MELGTKAPQASEEPLLATENLLEAYQELLKSYELLNNELAKLKQEVVEYKQQANYWKAQFDLIHAREDKHKKEIEDLKAKLRKREQQLFGRRSEKGKSAQNESSDKQSQEKKKRGQQRGATGPSRRDYSDLPTNEETIELSESEQCCPCCHLPYEEFPGTEDSEAVGIINVRPHKRVIRRKRYRRSCTCPDNPLPKIITAPLPGKIFPKSRLDPSVWAHLLLQKYAFQIPIQRILSNLRMHGLSLSPGTISGGLQKMLYLLTPIYDEIAVHNVSAEHWHADETGWKVFEKIEGKESSRWYLWVFKSQESVVYRMSPSRSSTVLYTHFGEEPTEGIVSVDRYSAYKAVAKKGLFLLAFCWAHVRRDFLGYGKGYPSREQWALDWVDRIATLYHINNQRTQCKQGSKTFQKKHDQLNQHLDKMSNHLHQELADDAICAYEKKLLKSLLNHWEGLTLFVEYPHVPMDNNPAERMLRPSVVGRNNYYGSGSIWSAELAALMFTVFNTLKLWDINSHTWLLEYFNECAMQGGKPPDNVATYLPWNMNEAELERLKAPPKNDYDDSS